MGIRIEDLEVGTTVWGARGRRIGVLSVVATDRFQVTAEDGDTFWFALEAVFTVEPKAVTMQFAAESARRNVVPPPGADLAS